MKELELKEMKIIQY